VLPCGKIGFFQRLFLCGQPVLVEQSVTRCQDVPMYIRQCV
jgi:hypothetical protein